MCDGMVDAICCQMCAHFLNFLGLSPNNTQDLTVNFVHFHFPGRGGPGLWGRRGWGGSNFRPRKAYVLAHALKMLPRPDSMQQQSLAAEKWGNASKQQARVSPLFTMPILLRLARGTAHELALGLWEKDKRPLVGAWGLEHLFSLLWFIGSIVTSLLAP